MNITSWILKYLFERFVYFACLLILFTYDQHTFCVYQSWHISRRLLRAINEVILLHPSMYVFVSHGDRTSPSDWEPCNLPPDQSSVSTSEHSDIDVNFFNWLCIKNGQWIIHRIQLNSTDIIPFKARICD